MYLSVAEATTLHAAPPAPLRANSYAEWLGAMASTLNWADAHSEMLVTDTLIV
jgi:hypothetical protein